MSFNSMYVSASSNSDGKNLQISKLPSLFLLLVLPL